MPGRGIAYYRFAIDDFTDDGTRTDLEPVRVLEHRYGEAPRFIICSPRRQGLLVKIRLILRPARRGSENWRIYSPITVLSYCGGIFVRHPFHCAPERGDE